MGENSSLVTRGKHWLVLGLFGILAFCLPANVLAWGSSSYGSTSSSVAQTAATAGTVVSGGSATQLTPSDCAECHGDNVAAGHHQTVWFEQGECFRCHEGVTTSGDCSTCHTFGLQNDHHQTAPALAGDCGACHTGVGDLGACLSCHEGKIQTRHHQVADASNINCNSCHTAMPATNDCLNCHTGSVRQRHHTVAETTNLNCNACHAQIQPIQNCQTCHQPGSKQAAHHNYAAASGTACTSCHTSLQPSAGCATCHGGGSTAQLHHDVVRVNQNLDCTACHTQMQSASGCNSCHDFAAVNPHHGDRPTTVYGMGCFDCHGWVFVGGVYSMSMPAPDQCVTCHTTRVGTGSIVETHHATTPAVTGQCTACHVGADVGDGACNTCHQSGSGTVSERHHAFDLAQSGQCTVCHVGADYTLLDCESCHTSGGQAPINEQHHMTIPAQMGDCQTCHTGVDAGSLDCSACHFATGSPAVVERHHTTEAYQVGNCSFCHVGSEPAAIACSACHVSPAHHAQPQAVAGDCAYCHSTIQISGSGCQACHTAPIPQIHHGDPLASVGGDCSVCHQSVSSPEVCANCHSASPHHETTYAQAGDCTHCHKVPQSATDRPKQAACRECHGQYQHNKGGPIQDYGACAACHDQDTFHAAPGRAVGYTRSAPGKGKFAIFWNQYTSGGDEEVREDVSPNGEDMNDEGGYRWRNPTLSFKKKQISHNGRNYTVPHFDANANGDPRSPAAIAGGGSGGGSASPPEPANGNLALNKNVSASRSSSGYEASKAVDGSTSSRWWSREKEDQWLQVDLGGSQSVSKIVIKWHSYYANEYQVRVSSDGRNWTRVREQDEGRGGTETVTFSSRSARYVQLYCKKAERDSGFSVLELEVYAR